MSILRVHCHFALAAGRQERFPGARRINGEKEAQGARGRCEGLHTGIGAEIGTVNLLTRGDGADWDATVVT